MAAAEGAFNIPSTWPRWPASFVIQPLAASKDEYYTFKVHSRSLLVNILQLVLNDRQLWRHFRRILWIIGWRCAKKMIGRWWRHYLKARENDKVTKFCKINRMGLFTATLCLHLSMTIFKLIIKQLMESAYAWYQELSRPRSMLSTSAFGFGR